MKVGMVGVGAISGIYLKNLTEMFKEVELVALCDLVKEKALKAGKEYGIEKIYDTMEEMFLDEDIDIILNLTRPYEHFDVTYKALEAGKHVYSEKPLAATLDEGRRLVELAKEKGRYLGGAPDTFLGAGITTCRKLIEANMIGDIVGSAAFMICRGHEGWHPDPEFYYKHGGGPLFDMGPYYITALVQLIGGVKSVTGVARTTFKERVIGSQPLAGQVISVDVPTHVTGIMEFDNGAVGTLTTTFDVHNKGQARVEIYGSEGTLIVPDPNTFGGPILLLCGEDGDYKEMPLMFDYSENSRGLGLCEMAKAIERGDESRVSDKLTLHVLEIMDAFHVSSRERKTIDLATNYQPLPIRKKSKVKGVIEV